MSKETTAIQATAAVLRKSGERLQIENITVQPPRPDEVLIRMVGVGVCHTDIVCRDGFPVPMPIVLGHEGSGVVEAVGAEVKNLGIGDHVVLSFNSCGHCVNCDSHKPASCTQFLAMNFAGVRLADGSSPLSQDGATVHGTFFGQSSFATYAIAKEINAVKVSPAAPLEILGPLGCGFQTGAGAAMISLGLQAGESLAIFGGGAVGLSAVMGAKVAGAAQIVVVEPNAARRKLATELGATAVIDPIGMEDVAAEIRKVSGGGVRHAIDSTGIPAVIVSAVNSVYPGGTVGLVGLTPPGAVLDVPMIDLMIKGVTIKPITEGDADPQVFIPQMVDLFMRGKFPIDKLIGKFPFDQVNEAMHASETGAVIKPVLVF